MHRLHFFRLPPFASSSSFRRSIFNIICYSSNQANIHANDKKIALKDKWDILRDNVVRMRRWKLKEKLYWEKYIKYAMHQKHEERKKFSLVEWGNLWTADGLFTSRGFFLLYNKFQLQSQTHEKHARDN